MYVKKKEKTLEKCHLYFAVIQICKINSLSLWQLYLILLCRYDQLFFFFLLFSLACQCNGHSTCINNNVCEQCKNLTTGKQCQDCMPGYYGDPTNGGQCTGNYFFFHFNVFLLQERKLRKMSLLWKIYFIKEVFFCCLSIFGREYAFVEDCEL